MRFNKALFLFAITTADAGTPDSHGRSQSPGSGSLRFHYPPAVAAPVRPGEAAAGEDVSAAVRPVTSSSQDWDLPDFPRAMPEYGKGLCDISLAPGMPAVNNEIILYLERNGIPTMDSPFCKIMELAVASTDQEEFERTASHIIVNLNRDSFNPGDARIWNLDDIFRPEEGCKLRIPDFISISMNLALLEFSFSYPNEQRIATFCKIMRMAVSDDKVQEAARILSEMNGLYDAAVGRIHSLKGTHPPGHAGKWLTTPAFLKKHCNIDYKKDGPRQVMIATMDFIFSMPNEASIAVFCELMRNIL